MMIDILAWDWNLRIAINPATRRPRSRFRGLEYGRDFTLQGRIRAPHELRGRKIGVILSPFGPKVRFGWGGSQHVGSLRALPSGFDLHFEATLMLPEEAMATTAMSLASTWKHLQIQTCNEHQSGAKVSAYFFHAGIPPNLEVWASAD